MLSALKQATKQVPIPGNVFGNRPALSKSTSTQLDGGNIKKLLKDEKEFDKFLNKYFDMLDEDKSGKLTREEMKPALIRFGVLLGLPPAGNVSEADELVDKMYTTLMAESLEIEVDRPSFITISKEFLRSISEELQERPLEVQVYDGSVLQELSSNPEQMEALIADIFTEFDADGSGQLTRNELKPALISLGLIPPRGAKPAQDALISQVVGKYGGQSMEVGPVEFRSLLKDILEELSAEFEKDPIILPPLEVLTGADLRRTMRDKQALSELASNTFFDWDILKRGRLSRSEIVIGFKKYTRECGFTLMTPEEAEALCNEVFRRADEDQSGFVELPEFEPLFAKLLTKMAEKLDQKPAVQAFGSSSLDSAASTANSFMSWISSSVGSVGAQPAKPPEKRSLSDVKAAYNYQPSEAAVAAAEARRKLEERGKKLAEMRDETEQLNVEAAEYSDLASQLAKKMEKKWW